MGCHDGSFYFRLLFRDGRDFWLAPILALGGGWFCAREQGIQRRAGLFTVLWLVLLLFVFSYFVYSLSPFRFIPKSPNYALIFAAPIALLAGVALDRMRTSAAIASVILLAVGGLILAALNVYASNLEAATHRATIRFAQMHDSAVVFSVAKTLAFNTVDQLMGQEHASNLRKFDELVAVIQTDRLLPAGTSILVAYSSSWPPEAITKIATLFRGSKEHCLQPMGETVGEPGLTDKAVTTIVATIRAALPPWADRHMRYTDNVLSPAPVKFYALNRLCLAQEMATTSPESSSF